MRNITKVLILLSLLSIGAFAQAKPKIADKSKIAAKSSNEKSTVKPISKSAVKSTVKPATKPTVKPAVKSAAKPTVKSSEKPAVKSTAKPAAVEEKQKAKPPIKQQVKQQVKQPAIQKAKPQSEPKIEKAEKPLVYKGETAGNTYTNRIYNFEITLPDGWVLPGEEFEKIAREQGFDLNPETPKAVDPKLQTKLNRMTGNVSVLLNAFKYAAATNENAFLRISIEDLQDLPQVKDAVDYFDLMRETYKNIKLPADFKYSETQAERLGKWQFGVLDTANKKWKKRMYATVRNGYALMFTLTYKSDEDLEALKGALSRGNFRLN